MYFCVIIASSFAAVEPEEGYATDVCAKYVDASLALSPVASKLAFTPAS